MQCGNMGSFWNLISCCHATTHTVAPPTAPQSEEACSLVPVTCEGNKHRPRIKFAAQWQPSLCTISEDEVVIKAEKREGSARQRNKLLKKKKDDSQFHRRLTPYEASIPAFSPGAFIF